MFRTVPRREWLAARHFFFDVGWNCLNKEGLKLYKPNGNWRFDPLEDGANEVLVEQCRWTDNPSNLDWLMKYLENDLEFAEDNTSMFSFPFRQYFISKFFFIKDQDGGFEKIPENLANDFLLSDGAISFKDSALFEFNQYASSIFYDESGQEEYRTVVYTNLDTTNGAPTSSSIKVRAKRIINTVGIGVQNNGNICYEPTLTYGTSPFEMADFVKVFYQFNDKFWEDRQFIASIKEEDNDGRCVYWMNLDYSIGQRKGPKKTSPDIIKNSKILVCFLTTEAFRGLLGAANELTEAQLKIDLLRPLKQVYGDMKVTNAYVKAEYPRLHNDPSFLGSYENWQVGMDLTDFYHYCGSM